jgi:hypothetical protein
LKITTNLNFDILFHHGHQSVIDDFGYLPSLMGTHDDKWNVVPTAYWIFNNQLVLQCLLEEDHVSLVKCVFIDVFNILSKWPTIMQAFFHSYKAFADFFCLSNDLVWNNLCLLQAHRSNRLNPLHIIFIHGILNSLRHNMTKTKRHKCYLQWSRIKVWSLHP